MVQPMDPEPHHDSPNNHSPQRQRYHSDEHSFQELLVVLRRGRWTILLTTAIVLIVAALYTMLARPVYEATASVLIDTQSNAGTIPVFDFTGSGITNKITNELEGLRSPATTEAVAQALVDRKYVNATTQHVIAIIHDRDSATVLSSIPIIAERLSDAVDFAPVKESDVIKITARSNDPEEASLIANTYVHVYANRDVSSSRAKLRTVREFLQSQLTTKHHQLDSIEQSLQSYMAQSGIVSLDAEADRVINQLSQLEATRDGLEGEIASHQKTLTSLKAEFTTQEPNVAKAMSEQNDGYIRMLQGQLARLEVERDLVAPQKSASGTGEENARTNRLNDLEAQISQLRKTLRTRTESLLGSVIPESREVSSVQGYASILGQLKQQIIQEQVELDGLIAKKTALSRVIKDYDRQFNQIPQKNIKFAKLQRARLSTEKLYLLVEERFNEAGITESSEFGSVNIMAAASVPLRPISPKPLLNLTIALLLGIAGGFGITIVRSSLDTRLRGPDDLKRLGISPIGVIQKMQKGAQTALAGTNGGAHDKPFDPSLVVYHNPLLSDSEGYRHLRTAIQDSINKEPIGIIAVTSANQQEGKSTVTANLSLSFALMEGKCLLIDADLRRPTAHKLFGLQREPGLGEVLTGKADVHAVVHKDVVENLDLLTAGGAVDNPAELLARHTMVEFIQKIRSRYRIVLLDTPPLLTVTDAGIMARVVDGVLVVTESGTTTAEMLEAISERLKSQHCNFLGYVLNKFDARSAYGSRHYGYRVGYGPYEYRSSKKLRNLYHG